MEENSTVESHLKAINKNKTPMLTEGCSRPSWSLWCCWMHWEKKDSTNVSKLES